MDLSEFVKKHPKHKRRATDKQVEFAKKIANTLEIDLPDFNDFKDTNEFISENVDDYYEEVNNCSFGYNKFNCNLVDYDF